MAGVVKPLRRTIALGVFDGLHLAHRAVLEQASAALLFPVHPQQVLSGAAPPALLTDAERDARLRAMGLELLFVPFEEICRLPPQVFFERVLLQTLGAAALCCGYHYHFGRGAEGGTALLRELCAEHGVGLTVIPKLEYQGEPISSTRIRAALAQGNLCDAAAMLGRPFGYTLPVVAGDRIGRTLGAPTINQLFAAGFCVPRHGVYASETCLCGQWRASVTNIGRRPSFASTQLRSETHILEYDGDLYGQEIPVRLLRFLRDERAFATMQELMGQIAQDKANAIDN